MLYFSLIIISCVLYIILKKYNSKYYLFLTFFLLFLMAAFRKCDLWIDLAGYEKRHIYLKFLTNWETFFNNYLVTSKDVGYYVLEWISTKLGISFQVWIAIIAAFFLFVIGKLIHIKSYQALISTLLFLGLGFYSFSMSGLRQVVAISLTVLAYEQLDEDHNWRFIILTLIASLFHKTAIVFIVLLFLKKVKFGKFHIIGFLIGLVGFFSYKNQLREILNTYFFTENYSGYSTSTSTLTYTRFFILLAIFVFCLLYYKKVNSLCDFDHKCFQNEKKIKIRNPLLLYNALFLGTIIQLYSSFVAEMFRVSMYFSLYAILLVPLALYSEKNGKLRNVFTMIICLIILLYILISGGLGVQYQTIWG